jgi:hypothetical protein
MSVASRGIPHEPCYQWLLAFAVDAGFEAGPFAARGFNDLYVPKPHPCGSGGVLVLVRVTAAHGVPPWESVERPPMRPQRRQQRPITWAEPRLLSAQLALPHSDLVAQDEDLGVGVPITHRQQPQQRERVRHTEIRQS